MNKKHLLLLILFIFSSCSGSDDDDIYLSELEIQDVTLSFFRSFPEGSYVFRNQSELENAWATAPFEVYPVGIVIEEPIIATYDYSEFTVVGLSHGIGYWCFKPNIISALSDGTNLFVHYTVSTTSTSACLRNGPLISFVLVPGIHETVIFVQVSESENE